MITIKTKEEIELMREGGAMLARVLKDVVSCVKPGRAIKELDATAEREIRACNADPIFLGYRNSKKDIPYPATLCVSVNDEVVHGIGTRDTLLREGDIVGLDIGFFSPNRNGVWVGMAATPGVWLISFVTEKNTKSDHT